jgi:hypothetical protein
MKLTVQRQAIILSIGLDGAVEKNIPCNLKIRKNPVAKKLLCNFQSDIL